MRTILYSILYASVGKVLFKEYKSPVVLRIGDYCLTKGKGPYLTR